MPRKKKRGVGRPEIPIKVDLAMVEKYGALGLTIKEFGYLFGVSEKTAERWAKRPQIVSALKKGKSEADAGVSRALYRNATGYEYTEDLVVKSKDEKGLPVERVVTVTKRTKPETLAQIFWLKNRQPDRWRDVKHDVVVGDPEKPIGVKIENGRERTAEILGILSECGVIPRTVEKTVPVGNA